MRYKLIVPAIVLLTAFAVGCSSESRQDAPAPQTEPAAATSPALPPGPPPAPPTAPSAPQLPDTGPQSPEKVIRILQDRLARLESVVVAYRTKVTYPPLAPGEKAISRPEGRNFSIVRLTGTRDWAKGFCRLGDLFRYESKTLAIEGDPRGPDWWPDTTTQITTYTPEVSEYLGLDKENKPTRGVINPARGLPHPEIEIALGLRAHGQTDVLTPDALAGMRYSMPDDQTFVLSVDDNEKSTHKWTYLRAHGYALGNYHRFPPPGRTVHHEAAMSDFRDAGGMIMPYAMTLASRTMRGDEVQRVNVQTDAAVTRYWIGDDENTPTRYRIRWPAGTRLFDKRKPAGKPATKPTSGPATQATTAPTTRP